MGSSCRCSLKLYAPAPNTKPRRHPIPWCLCRFGKRTSSAFTAIARGGATQDDLDPFRFLDHSCSQVGRSHDPPCYVYKYIYLRVRIFLKRSSFHIDPSLIHCARCQQFHYIRRLWGCDWPGLPPNATSFAHRKALFIILGGLLGSVNQHPKGRTFSYIHATLHSRCIPQLFRSAHS